MARYLIKLEVELPDDFFEDEDDNILERELDEALADAICDLGYECIESKPYQKLD